MVHVRESEGFPLGLQHSLSLVGRRGTPVHSVIKRLRGSEAGVWGETSRDPGTGCAAQQLGKQTRGTRQLCKLAPEQQWRVSGGGRVGRGGRDAKPLVEDSGILEACLASVQAVPA